MRFLVDENVSPRLAEYLVARGHDVLFIPTSELRGRADSVLHDLAVDEARLVITRDLRFPVSPALPGIVFLRTGNQTPAQFMSVMRDFVESRKFQEIEGRITVVSPGRDPRSRRLPHT